MAQQRCKYCDSDEVVKYGRFRGVQRWWCKKCRRKFVRRSTLPGMKTPVWEVSATLEMFYSGKSLADICHYLGQKYDEYPSDSTVYQWIRRASEIAIDAVKDYKPVVGDAWVVDEMAFTVGNEKIWVWDIIDSETAFLLASHICRGHAKQDSIDVMENAAQKAGKMPGTVLTHRPETRADWIRSVLGAETQYIRADPSADRGPIMLVETFHSLLEPRTMVINKLKKIEVAKLLMQGWLVRYNYFERNEFLGGQTPAQRAGIVHPFRKHLWRDFIRQSADQAQYG